MIRYTSPLRYPGGKSQLARFLIEILKANDIHKPHYIEPYAGGAGAALHLLFDEHVEDIRINDADPSIRCFWEAAVKKNEAFLSMLSEVEISVAEWKRQRAIYEKRDLRKVLALGFATFYLNRTSRSGIIWNGGPVGGHDQSGEYKIGARFNREELLDRIARIGRYRHRIQVSGMDGLDLLKEINGDRKRARRTFVYLDPPYYHKGAELYLNPAGHEAHESLARYLTARRQFPWIMTYDNVKEIRALYSSLDVVPFDLSYSAYERRQGRELAIVPRSICVSKIALKALRQAA